jgi:hypothetical protein
VHSDRPRSSSGTRTATGRALQHATPHSAQEANTHTPPCKHRYTHQHVNPVRCMQPLYQATHPVLQAPLLLRSRLAPSSSTCCSGADVNVSRSPRQAQGTDLAAAYLQCAARSIYCCKSPQPTHNAPYPGTFPVAATQLLPRLLTNPASLCPLKQQCT